MKMLLNEEEREALTGFVKWNQLNEKENLEMFIRYLLAAEREDRPAIVKVSSGLVFSALRKIFDHDKQAVALVRACEPLLPTQPELPGLGIVEPGGEIRPVKIGEQKKKEMLAAVNRVVQHFR